MRKLSLLIVIAIISLIGQGQNIPSVDLAAGFGFTESFHVGCKIQVSKRSQLGLSYGNSLVFKNTYHSFNLDHQLHFGKVSEKSNRSVWFFRQGIAYSFENTDYSEHEYLILVLSLGREFNITPSVGFSADFGLSKAVIDNEKILDPSKKPWLHMNLNRIILPCARIQFFYSF